MIRSHSASLRYTSAVAFPAAALLASVLLRPVLDPSLFLPFVAAVFLTSWYFGLGPGMVAAAGSVLFVELAFLTHIYTLAIGTRSLVARLSALAIVCVLVAYLVDRRRSKSRLLSAMPWCISEGIIATDHRGLVCFINPAAEEMTGWTRSAALGKPSKEIVRLSDEKTRETMEDPLWKSMNEGKMIALRDHALLIPREGAEIPIEESASPIRDPEGKIRGAVLLFRDISRHRQMMDQASHSQKMEAVGRLASGVAGDFNNLLTIITGYSEFLRGELVPGNPLRRFADEIQLAAERAAGVTRQLLAFGRGQVVQAKPLDVNAVMANMDTMLRRVLGEKIEVVFLPGPALGRVKCDTGQIEQVIVNLAMNSRDAMPNGGRFVLETANVDLEEGDDSRRIGIEPGSYVMIGVSDTGCGMDTETRSRLFEPFFTTKGEGRGSGLGLSTVYGIVKQNHGQITVYSQVGSGTIFEIYLPRTKESVELAPRGRLGRAGGGSETVLLVDNEDGVRKLCSAVLQSNGYTVIEAADGAAGLAAFEKNGGQIDLLLTDVVMPQMNGFELAELLAERDPRMGILFMSAYRDNPIGAPSRESNRPLLHKPFTPDTLLSKVRETLDARANSAHS
jgi:two-component system cell cycle sensor histidine kinase/response regulator CckA